MNLSTALAVNAIKLVLALLPIEYSYGLLFDILKVVEVPPIGVIVTLKGISFGVETYKYWSNGFAGPLPVDATGGM